MAFVGAGRNTEQEKPDFEIVSEDWERLRADMAKHSKPKEAIIECSYNAPRCVGFMPAVYCIYYSNGDGYTNKPVKPQKRAA